MNSNSNNNPQPTVIKRTVNHMKVLECYYGTKCNNPEEALTMAYLIAYNATLSGYLVCTTASLDTYRVEVTIHLGNRSIPRYDQATRYTSRTLTSQEYWDDDDRVNRRVRTVEYRFEFVAS